MVAGHATTSDDSNPYGIAHVSLLALHVFVILW
jgi:hypothetical protein